MPARTRVDYAHMAAFYDLTPAYATRPDVSFYVAQADEHGDPVLELGCGTGRVLLPVARAGHRVVGLDGSEAMLEVFGAKLAAEPDQVRQRVTLVAGDMCDFELDERFALVTIPFRPFQHLLEVEEQLACLGCVRRHLRAGGVLVFDVFNPSLSALIDPARLEQQPDGEPFGLPDGRRVQRYARLVTRDLCAQRLEVEMTHEVAAPDGTVTTSAEMLPLRWFYRFEMEHLLARAGFEVVELYGGFDQRRFAEPGPSEMVWVARAATP